MPENGTTHNGREVIDTLRERSVRILTSLDPVTGELINQPQVGRRVKNGNGKSVEMWFNCNLVDQSFVDMRGRLQFMRSDEVTSLGYLLK